MKKLIKSAVHDIILLLQIKVIFKLNIDSMLNVKTANEKL